MSDDRALLQPVQPEGDIVPHATGGNLKPPVLAVENERHGDDRLERVSLRAPGW
jgi:hypothetical protein